MELLIRGRAETITVTRTRGVTVSSAVGYRNDTGESASCTIVIVNGAVAATLSSASTRGSSTLYASGVTAGNNYRLVSSDGRELGIYVSAVSGTTITIDQRLPWDVSAGTIYSVTSTITITVPTAYDLRYLDLEYTLSNGDIVREGYLVGNRRLHVPVTTDTILARFPRLRNRTQGDLGFEDQIADAVRSLRAHLWQLGYVLDDLSAPAILMDYLVARIGLQLVVAGYDLSAGGDMFELRRELERQRDHELSEIINARNLWIDESEDRIADDDEQGPVGGITLRWRST